MNQPNPVGALSEIDRLGQAALDAVYRESEARGPRYREIDKLMQESEAMEPQAVMEKLTELLGAEDTKDVFTKAISIFQAAAERDRAMTEYVQARRLLTQAGVL